MVRDRISSRLLSTITGVLATIPTYQSNVCELIEFLNDSCNTQRQNAFDQDDYGDGIKR